MRSPRSRVGQSAEIAAAAELGRRGYRIVCSNYRCRAGEIDLIAEDAEALVFVEVRCKRGGEYGSPAESITHSKQRKLIATAQDYLFKHGSHERACRFDVVEVVPNGDRLVIADVIQNAFSCE